MNKEDRKDLVERLRDISRGDHERGCQGREYVCSCDYDETSWKTAEEAADEIDRLTQELEEARRALEPFAKRADRYNDIPGILRIHDDVELWQVQKNKGLEVDIAVGDLRTARAALRAGEEGK